jgi:hypothetical protein
VREVNKLGGALAIHTGYQESVAVSHLFQRLSILMMKGDAALINNRTPDHVDPTLDGEAA